MQVIFSYEDTAYMQWQMELFRYSYHRAGMASPLTPICSACVGSEEMRTRNVFQAKKYDCLVDGECYPPLNKPGGIAEWAAAQAFSPDQLVFIADPDSVFLRRLPDPPPLLRGEAYGQEYRYLDPSLSQSKLVLSRHCSPKALPRVSPVGIYLLMYRSDLAELAPLWLQKAIEIRCDSHCRLALGDDGWVSEMWGYIISAAELGIRHRPARFSQDTGSGSIAAPIVHYCYPIVSDGHFTLPLSPEVNNWSKWTYRPWEIPPTIRNAPLEGNAVLSILAELALSREQSSL